MHHINRIKDQNYVIILIDVLKAFDGGKGMEEVLVNGHTVFSLKMIKS